MKGVVAVQKALQMFGTETRELLGGKRENSVLLDEGSLMCTPGKSIKYFFSFNKKQKQKKVASLTIPGEVQPLRVAELVADEVEVTLTSHPVRDQTNHLDEAKAGH